MQPTHNRVEFTADLGFGDVVVGFVDFSGQGISFGVPHRVLIKEGIPEEPSKDFAIKEYERVTVHTGGRVETHWASGESPKGWDVNMSPLAKWDKPWSRRFELVWTPEYLKFMQRWFDDPKPPTHVRSLKVPVSFTTEAEESVVCFAVTRPDSDVGLVAQVIPGDGQLWALTGGWPWVLVRMSNVSNTVVTELNTVGRDYR